MRAKAWGALAGASVIVVMFASAQQTGALWRAETPVSGLQMTADTLVLRLGADYASATESYTMTGFGGTAMGPGAYSQRPITIANRTAMIVQYELTSASQSQPEPKLNLTVWQVGSNADCPTTGTPTGTQLYTGPLTAAKYPATPLPTPRPTLSPNTSSTWCLRATVNASAAQGQSTTATLNFKGTQFVPPRTQP
ncbi:MULTISPECIES: hypothetical protein [Rhodococcus]|uniref:hypothetical protein n=1 Tax=Rhodococcus TaxID=1827 RepID=UPI000A6D1C11|nr:MULTISPECIES: hypothetical protein [Rhodococcus]ROZ49603.1 hypothetical protein EEB13_06775 [Rhodococcus sp. WS3]